MNSKFIIIILSLLCLFSYSSHAANNLTQGQSLQDGDTLISTADTFTLGFFSPKNSTNRYLGIWYTKVSVQTVVWVANRETPILDRSGVLTFGRDGNLVVRDGRGRELWSTSRNITVVTTSNVTATLMDEGNLCLFFENEVQNSIKALWQSFDEPTDTYLPGMRVNVRPRARPHYFRSWKSESDPAIGNYSMGLDPDGLLEIVVWRGEEKYWRSGLWNGLIFIGVPNMTANYLYGFRVGQIGERSFFSYTVNNSTEILRFRLRWDGLEEQMLWDQASRQWNTFWGQPRRACEYFNTCGPYGSCSTATSPMCSCVQGFVPKSRVEWDSGNWTGGCVRRMELQCNRNVSNVGEGEADRFLEMDGIKLPDYSIAQPQITNVSECERHCMQNCTCKAYAYLSGVQCLTWGREFVDLRQFQQGGQKFFLRLAASEIGTSKKKSILVVVLPVVLGVIFLFILAFIVWRCKTNRGYIFSKGKPEPVAVDDRGREYWKEFSGQDDGEGNKNGPELTMHSFQEILNATDNFSNDNKLGEGGFGPVYKGKLPCGLDVAVKRLSRKSGQGLDEFKNEIILIAKLQHRNLVRLIGYCVDGEEKMLIYEYLPNKSLDAFIFANRQEELDWGRRSNIIEGISRGLLYLHRDSRLLIIHRDMKASNILLDEEMNPKISDFGMARIFGSNDNEANTLRVVGTYGYMAPEYAMEGLFSVKSDVYSFGVLLLEIVSGKKNSYRHPDYSVNLVGYSWILWSEERAAELIDPSIRDSCSLSKVLRCINVGLLCVQDSATDRPAMSTVVLMLESDMSILPYPKQPMITMGRNPSETPSIDNSLTLSTNGLTNTMVEGR
ncbi:non-specific serine/threonine protein kinase [Ranunculus cassubicifolius]